MSAYHSDRMLSADDLRLTALLTSDCQCQACGHPGVDMFDICPACFWENDISLVDEGGNIRIVGYELSERERGWRSHANQGDTPYEYLWTIPIGQTL